MVPIRYVWPSPGRQPSDIRREPFQDKRKGRMIKTGSTENGGIWARDDFPTNCNPSRGGGDKEGTVERERR